MILMYIVIGVMAALLAVCFGTYLYTFFAFTKKQKTHTLPSGDDYSKSTDVMHRLISDMASFPVTREYSITSFDGLTLWAKYYHVSDGAPLHIQMHGYRGSAIRDFCGGNPLAREMGHNTLVVHQRAHGKSDGRTICFGIKERFDCRDWAEFAARTFGKDTPIFLSGVSMGAATVLMARALPINANIVGVIADCPYNVPRDIICHVAKQRGFPDRLIYPFIYLGARLFGNLRLNDAKADVESHIPTLIIHGQADKFVPCEMSAKIAHTERHTFVGAGHALSYMTDTDRYKKVIKDFVNQTLGETK